MALRKFNPPSSQRTDYAQPSDQMSSAQRFGETSEPEGLAEADGVEAIEPTHAVARYPGNPGSLPSQPARKRFSAFAPKPVAAPASNETAAGPDEAASPSPSQVPASADSTRMDYVEASHPQVEGDRVDQPSAAPPSTDPSERAQPAFAAHDSISALVSVYSLLRKPIRPRRFVLGKIAERGVVTLVVSSPGTGKTTLGMHFASAVAAGRNWAGLEVQGPGEVIYYNAEEPTEEIARRLSAFAQAGLLDEAAQKRASLYYRGGSLRIMSKTGGVIETSAHGKEFRDEILSIRPALVIIDPLALTHGLDENLNSDMTQYIEFFKFIAAEADCAIIIMHHTTKDTKPIGKDTKSASMYASRGASALPASVRSMWQLGSIDDNQHVVLSCVKANNFARERELFFNRTSVQLENGDDIGLLEPATPTELATGRSGRERY